MKVTSFMVKIYAGLIMSGSRTMETIPEAYREAVAAELAAK
ncbi:CD1375 family protein [Anaeromusa sp.]|nr:CD1375 family protein [Anaeromusa sp.]MDD3157282.1 CD1375 family protein [Anaeromusa sp.]